jgi:uncharacterized membrane protein YwaF
MRTALIIAAGLVLLGVCVLVARWLGDPSVALANAAKIFIPLWLIVALLNMWVGVARAGYSVREELPIFLVIFAIPAVVAAILWRKFS